MTRGTAGGAAAVAIVAGALAVTGAGAAGAGTIPKVRLKADPGGELKFNKSRLSAAPGRTTIVMKNPSSSGSEHGIEVEGNGAEKRGKIVQPGGTSKVTLKLKPGKYEYYCPVTGHKAAGMKGKLTVK
jgi:plastocyanin